MRLPVNLRIETQEDKNLFYMVAEVFFTAILASAQSFFQLFALRLGASNTEIGLLTSLPALFTILLSIPIGKLLQSRPNPRRWVFGGLIANRLVLGLLVVVPLLQPAGFSQGTLVVGILILAGIPQLVFTNGIYPIIMKLLPTERWASLFSLRSMVSLITTAGGVALLGLWLQRSPFPANYQVLISVTLAISLGSLFFWMKARQAGAKPAEPEPAQDNSFRQQFKILESLNLGTDFGRVILNQLLQYIGIWMVTPLYILYLVKSLGAAESWLGMNTTIISISALIGSLLARFLMGRWGEPRVLRIFSQATAVYPLLLGLSTSLTPVLFAGALNSLLLPIYGLSHNNNLLGSFPPGKEHEGIALYNTLTSIGSFILPLVGVALADRFGIQPVLISGGLLSLAGSLSFWIWPVRGEGLAKSL